MSEILLIGGSGMLGRAFATELTRRGRAFRAVDLPDVDLAKPDTVVAALNPGTSLVLNCAAYTDVDGAETHEAEATAVNGTGVGALAERCAEVGAKLVHYSTDYVFDGKACLPYPVDHVRKPQNAYGRSKALGEELLERSQADYLLIRTSWLYAPYGKNFVLTMRELVTKRPEIKVVADQVGRPTSAPYLAERSLALLERGASGAFHVTDGSECSWHGFASAIACELGSACRIVPCTSEEFPRPAKRPAFSVLDLTKTDALIGPSRDFRLSLHETLAALR